MSFEDSRTPVGGFRLELLIVASLARPGRRFARARAARAVGARSALESRVLVRVGGMCR